MNDDLENNIPKVIGITGGIGSGKSSVSQYIESCGFAVYNSDAQSKDIADFNPQVKEKIIALLGTEAYDELGKYNRKYVAQRIFSNDELRFALNAIIHPATRENFQQWLSEQNSKYVFKESALLFELGLYKECYKTLLVTADDSIRMKRVMHRDQKTYREVESIIAKQMPESEKIKLADFVIFNNSSLQHLRSDTEDFLTQLKKL